MEQQLMQRLLCNQFSVSQCSVLLDPLHDPPANDEEHASHAIICIYMHPTAHCEAMLDARLCLVTWLKVHLNFQSV